MGVPKSVQDLAAKTKDTISFDREVKGCNFEEPFDLHTIIKSYETTGFQASNLHSAIEEVKRMRDAKIFFGCTSNIISSGIRDVVRYLVKHKFLDVLVMTAGGIEEDLIKTLKPTFCAEFTLKGKELRENGYNRVGNVVIPNENYEAFELWFSTVIDEITEGHTAQSPRILTPSAFIRILGEKINSDESYLYWAAKNNIPVYSPAITDGSIGDLLTFHKRRSCLALDVVKDIEKINYEAVHSGKNGAIILGTGLVKHHILNCNLFNNGLDYCVLVNTASEYDGSDAGASLDESVSWGKVKPDGSFVKVFGDATILFPLMVASTFAKK